MEIPQNSGLAAKERTDLRSVEGTHRPEFPMLILSVSALGAEQAIVRGGASKEVVDYAAE